MSHTRIEWLLADDPWFRGRAIVIGDAGGLPVGEALPAFMRRRMPRVVLVVRNSMQLVRWEMGLEPHTEADVARTMRSTLGFLAAAEA